MNLSLLLQNTLSPDHASRHQASRLLEEARSVSGLGEYLSTLCRLLSTDTEQPAVRIAAGLAAKNALTNRRDAGKQAELSQRWLQLSPAARDGIKESALSGLSATGPAAIGTTAAQLVAAIACIELPAGHWDDLIDRLMKCVSGQDNVNLQRAAVEAIGFVCEEAEQTGAVLETQSGAILTAVVGGGMQASDLSVRVAACRALLNSLEFAAASFGRPSERSFIMQRVCEAAAQVASEELSVLALQCLVRIVHLYYHAMADYMPAGLETLTISAMQRADAADPIKLQAIEFWSTVCDVELEIQEQLDSGDSDFADAADPPAHLMFARKALPRLLPVLLWLLCQQSEEYGEEGGSSSSEDWTPAMAAATSLSLLSLCVRDDVLKCPSGNSDTLLLGFVQNNLQNPSTWRLREAAAMAFGSVLDGPDPSVMAPLVSTALPLLTSLLSDPNVAVRDTVAWCIGEALREFLQVLSPDQLSRLAEALLRGLEDRQRVAGNCAWALKHMIEQLADTTASHLSLPLELYSAGLQGLLRAAMRPDAGEANLRTSAFQSLAAVINIAPSAALDMVDQLAGYLVAQLEGLAVSAGSLLSADDRFKLQDLQGHYAAVLQSAVKVLDSDRVLRWSDRLMATLLQQMTPLVASASSRPPTPASTATDDPDTNQPSLPPSYEEFLLLLGAVIGSVGESASKYMDGMAPVLGAALSGSYHAETSLCLIAVIDIGEAGTALRAAFLPYAAPFLQVLAGVLSSSTIAGEVKPKAISVVGDIALAIGPSFSSFLPTIMPMLLQAAQAASAHPSDMDDWEQTDLIVEMRQSLVTAFTCIVQGCSDDLGAAQALSDYIPVIVGFLKSILMLGSDGERTVLLPDDLLKGAMGLLGDIASAYYIIHEPFAKTALHALSDPWIGKFLEDQQRRRRHLSEPVSSVLKWAASMMARVRAQ